MREHRFSSLSPARVRCTPRRNCNGTVYTSRWVASNDIETRLSFTFRSLENRFQIWTHSVFSKSDYNQRENKKKIKENFFIGFVIFEKKVRLMILQTSWKSANKEKRRRVSWKLTTCHTILRKGEEEEKGKSSRDPTLRSGYQLARSIERNLS